MEIGLIVKIISIVRSKQGRGILFGIFMGIVVICYLIAMFFAMLVAAIVMNFTTEFYYPMPHNTYVSSSFNPGRKHPITGKIETHNGTDFPAPLGTPVLAPQSGTVYRIYEGSAEGKTVILIHDDNTFTKYKHLSAWLVKAGQVVSAGIPIGKCGSTGTDSTGNHLHFEIIINGAYVDAESLLQPWPEEMLGLVEQSIDTAS